MGNCFFLHLNWQRQRECFCVSNAVLRRWSGVVRSWCSLPLWDDTECMHLQISFVVIPLCWNGACWLATSLDEV